MEWVFREKLDQKMRFSLVLASARTSVTRPTAARIDTLLINLQSERMNVYTTTVGLLERLTLLVCWYDIIESLFLLSSFEIIRVSNFITISST